MTTVVDEITVDTLQEFADAFNAHDAVLFLALTILTALAGRGSK